MVTLAYSILVAHRYAMKLVFRTDNKEMHSFRHKAGFAKRGGNAIHFDEMTVDCVELAVSGTESKHDRIEKTVKQLQGRRDVRFSKLTIVRPGFYRGNVVLP